MKDQLAAALARVLGGTAAEHHALLAPPPRPEMGDLAYPCFIPAKAQRRNPAQVARELAEKLAAGPDALPLAAHVSAAGPYVNFRFDDAALARYVLKRAAEWQAAGFCFLAEGAGKTLTIDFSSPNIAKEFSVAHLRSTAIGHSLARIYEALGWNVVRINHLGDWGTQFGVLIQAFQAEGDEAALAARPLPYLTALYQKASRRQKAEREQQRAREEQREREKRRDAAQKEPLVMMGVSANPHETPTAGEQYDPVRALQDREGRRLDEDPYLHNPHPADDPRSVTAKARDAFAALERGDPAARALWQRFRELSLTEFKRVYDWLGIDFDRYDGEAHYCAQAQVRLKELATRGLLTEQDGAGVVEIEGRRAVVLRKSDGSTTYAARDVAAALSRAARHRFDLNVYVTDFRQREHFEGVFAVLARMGHPGAAGCRHVGFGTVTVAGTPMSTREGNVILLSEFINEVQQIARAFVDQTERDRGIAFEDKDALAEAVAIGAVVFAFVGASHEARVDFQPGEALSFEGHTGPRCQMLHVRLCSLFRTYKEQRGRPYAAHNTADPALLVDPAERRLLLHLAGFPEALRRAADEFAPALLAEYLLTLSDHFNHLWAALRVITDDERLTDARMLLMDRLKAVVARCLYLLGLSAPERM